MPTPEDGISKLGLSDWEFRLGPQIRRVGLVGEIPITADECAQLGKVINQRVETLGKADALSTLQRDYPCALAVYLVAQGMYSYQGGNFWSEVIYVTGLGSGYTSGVGQAFEQILEDLGLPLFYDMRVADKARRYVSLVLAHGGIPTYCLPDFFENMLQPAVLRAQYAGMSAAELIDEWRWRSSVQYFTDKPVLRFLVYGGHVAENFVERCREMAWEVLDSGVVPEAEEAGLPKRVVNAYGEWISEQGAEQVQRESADQWRLHRPEILVDPWGVGVVLDLPPQQIPATMTHADLAWQVTFGEEKHTIPVRVRRSGVDHTTNHESIPVSQPSAMIEISLLVDDQIKRIWRYRGVDEGHPLLVFDPQRSTLLSWQLSLPARCLGLIYPAQSELQVEGIGEQLEELPRLPWGWSGFHGGIWDLSNVSYLHLLRNGEEILTVPLRPDESAQRPHLVGGQLLIESPGVPTPVYVGNPPLVRIPLTGRQGMDEELARWRLIVRNNGPALPEVNTTTTLADLSSQLIPGEKHVDLPLNLPSLLGKMPFGNFVVRLRGPLGRDVEFTLRIVPHLEIYGHETLYLPDAQAGPQSATLLIETLPGDGLESRTEGDECRIRVMERREGNWQHEVEVARDSAEVELTVMRLLTQGDAVRVPVTVPIRRLRWALVGEQTGPSRREWTGHIVKRSVDTLLQTQSPYLFVELPVQETNQVQLTLRLLDVDDTELQVMPTASSPRGRQLWRFDMGAFTTTIRASRSPILRCELVVWNLPSRDDPLRLPVLSLTRTLIVDNVELKVHVAGGQAAFELRWREPAPLKNRCVRFWPLWRPWDSPFEQPLPDSAEETCTFGVKPDALRSGKYRLEFFVIDPWVSQVVSQRPPQGTLGTAEVELIAPDKQLELLESRFQKQGQSFDLLLERAAIYQDIGDPQKAQWDCQWCFEHMDEGTIPQILALAELVRAAGNPATQLALQLKMFVPHRIERLLDLHKQSKIMEDDFQVYFANLPRDMWPEATCRQLLSVENEAVRLRAVQQLICRGDGSGVDTVLVWVEAAKLSDADAIALLGMNPNFAVEYLQKRADDPVTRRLLDGLSQATGIGDIIRVGDWMHCDVGWGRVERIQNLRTNAEPKWIAGKQSNYHLHVTLRPDVFAEHIIVDLASAQARFTGYGKVFVCSSCQGFSTQDIDVMHQHFQEVHPNRSKKEKITAAYYLIDAEKPISLKLLEFTKRPSDQLL